MSEQLEGALHSLIVIEQAKGAIAQIYGITVDEALLLLRTYCRRHHKMLGQTALAFVTDPETAPVLTLE